MEFLGKLDLEVQQQLAELREKWTKAVAIGGIPGAGFLAICPTCGQTYYYGMGHTCKPQQPVATGTAASTGPLNGWCGSAPDDDKPKTLAALRKVHEDAVAKLLAGLPKAQKLLLYAMMHAEGLRISTARSEFDDVTRKEFKELSK